MKQSFAKRTRRMVVVLFFLSGAASLMYEVIWMRMLTIYVGGSDFSVSVVLTVFMAGLALGSAIAGRLVDHLEGSSRLLLTYGWLKLAVGLYGLLFPILMFLCRPLYALLYHHLLNNFLGYNATSSLISALLLIIPTTLMGITLPLLCRFVITDLPQAGTLMGRLYGADTLGAATGTFLCGFWLIGSLGVHAALTVAVAVHIAIGLFCIVYLVPALRRNPEPDNRNPLVTQEKVDLLGNALRNDTHRPKLITDAEPLYILLAVSAFCAMSYEVIWTKLLALLVGPTTYSFTIVLFTFITGLALGGLLFGWLADRSRNPFKLLVATQLAAAASVLAVSHFLGNSQIFFAKILYQLRDSFILLEATKAGLLFASMVVPTIFLGASIPIAVRIRTRDLTSVGSLVSRLYAISTVGALLGAFAGGFIIVPLFGKALGISVLVGFQGISAMLTSIRASFRRPQRSALAVVCAAALLVLCLFLPRWDRVSLTRGKYLRPDLYGDTLKNMSLPECILEGQERLKHLCTDQDILWIDDGIGGLVAAGKTVNCLGATIMFLSVNGKIVSSTQWDLSMMVTAGHLPMLLNKQVKNALVVGLGSGITAGEMLHYPLQRLDVVEICPEVVKACHLFAPFHNNLLKDPRAHIILQDARTHITLTDQKYDVIVSDPINPWMAGSAQLFTLEHFLRVKNRLNPGGIFVQWFHAYQSDWDVFSMFGRTFRQAFPNSLLVNTAVLGPDYLFIGCADDHQPMLNPTVPQRNYRYAAESSNMHMSDPSVIYPLIVTDIPSSLFGKGRIHTDEHPYMEYLAPRNAYTGGSDFSHVVIEKRQRSSRLQSLLSKFNSVANQLAFADFMASMNVTPFGLVRLGHASPLQLKQYRSIVERYCRVNMIEDYSRLTPYDRSICLPFQEKLVLAHIDALADSGAENWSTGEAYFYLAGIYAAENDYHRAIRSYRQGLVHLPEHQGAMLNLAACYEHLQNYTMAVDVLCRLTGFRPRSAILMTRLAADYLKIGNQDKALKWLGKALLQDGNYVPALVAAGMIYGTEGDYARAISYSEKALRINPGEVTAIQNLAIALSQVGKTGEALAYVKRGLEVSPANASLLLIQDSLVHGK